MKTLLIVSMLACLCVAVGEARAQQGVLSALQADLAPFVEQEATRTGGPAHQRAQAVCNRTGTCLLLGAVFTGAGIAVSALGVSFLLQLEDKDTSDDLITVPVILWGGTLLLAGLISTGTGLHLIGRGIRLRRFRLDVGWHGVPQARLRLRF